MKVFLLVAMVVFSFLPTLAQEKPEEKESKNFVEVRFGFTREGLDYREVDYVRSFKNGAFVNLNYSAATGQNEFWVGGGYEKQMNENFTIGAGAYLVVGKERNQLGLGLASFGEAKIKKINATFQVAAFVPAKGEVPKYFTIDTADLTYQVNKRVEVGVSTGAFFEHKDSNLIAGPIVKFNDKLGTTSFSLRGGAYTEFRVTRTFNF